MNRTPGQRGGGSQRRHIWNNLLKHYEVLCLDIDFNIYLEPYEWYFHVIGSLPNNYDHYYKL